MESKKIGEFIKTQRKKINLTQEELAIKLFVTEKAISRWETGRGTPDISLLIPLSKELNVTPKELLNGEKDNLETIVEYVEERNNKNKKYKFLTIIMYIISILIFLNYLKLEYQTSFIDYFIRLFIVIISSIFIIIGNIIYKNNYIEKIEDKKKINKLTNIILFIYYLILIYNMSLFSRTNIVSSYNIIPFKSIIDIIKNSSNYWIIINILGNFFIFMPFNYFIIEIFYLKKLSLISFISVLIVLIFELLQLILKVGVFDIDDIILCSMGMNIFTYIYLKIKGEKHEKNI